MKLDIKQLEFIQPELRNLCTWIEISLGLECTITSLYRIDDIGVHGQLPLRGIDIRMRNKIIGDHVAKLINKYWEYDSNRPDKKCAIVHGKDTNLHLHLQVHPNTIYHSL